MIVDLLIIFPIFTLSILGMKDGMVKKGIALLVTLVAVVLAQLTMDDMATMYVEEFDVERGTAVFYGYFTVFFGLILLQSLIFRLTAHDYKIGGIADRVVGAFFGFVQGVFIVSVVLMMLAIQRIPSRIYRVDSRLYTTIVNIAPQFLDFTLTTVPETSGELKEETGRRLDEYTKPRGGMQRPATTGKK